MENKKIKKLLMAAGLLAAVCPSIQAQDIDGYFRIQNGYGVTANGGTADDGHYVQQSDLFYAAPNLTAEQAKSKPGSIFYIKAAQQSDGSYKIEQLRSQGVELIGDQNNRRKSYLDFYKEVFNPLVRDQKEGKKAGTLYEALRTAGAEGYLFTTRALIESFIYDVAQTLKNYASNPNSPYYSDMTGDEKNVIINNIENIVDKFNTKVADSLDIDAYLVPTELSNGNKAYYLKIHTINFKKVTDFFNDPENMVLFKSGLDAMRNELGQTSSGETLDPFEVPIYYKLGYNLYENFEDENDDNPWFGLYNGEAGLNTDPDSPLYCTGQMSYEMIFTHPKLLFGWVKMQLYKMMSYPDNYNNPINIFGGGQYVDNYKDGYLYKFFKELGEDSTFMSYFSRYPYDQDVYVIDGYLSKDGTDEKVPGDTYKALGRFGFTQNVAHTDYSTYPWNGSTGIANNDPKTAHANQPAIEVGKGADEAKDGAKWVLKELSTATDDGLKVSASTNISGYFDGHYYTTLYVDFPIDIHASQAINPGIRFYGIGSEVKDGNYKDNNGVSHDYKYVTIDSLTDYVPKGQPVVVELPEAAAENNIVAVAGSANDGAYDVKKALLKGVFFNVGQSNAVTDEANASLAQKEENKLADLFDYEGTTDARRLERELVNRVGLNPIADGLVYTLQKSNKKEDQYNPIGFFKYGKYTLAANKAFIFVAAAETGNTSKLYIGGEGEATGINAISADTDSNKPVVIYDLAGRRVSNPTTGLYIVNGKKILISK